VLGFVSLYLMHSLMSRILGPLPGWLFTAVVAGLSGFGIYLGRFLRFNSWDVLFRPLKLYHELGEWFTEPSRHPASLAFPIVFGAFLFIAYVMLYALTHLPKIHSLSLRPQDLGPLPVKH